MRPLIVLIGLLTAGPQIQAGSTVYRCIGSAGEVTFSQTACGDAPVRQEARAAQALGEGLRASEQAWLKGRARATARTGKPAVPAADRGARKPDRQAYRCRRARQQLDAVQAERRRGYPAGKGAKLRQRAQRYRTYLDSFCS